MAGAKTLTNHKKYSTMPESHVAFTEAMLQPGFFSDSPIGEPPATSSVDDSKTIHIGGPPIRPDAKEPADTSALPPFQKFSDFPKKHEIIKPPLLIDGLLHQSSKAVFAGQSKTYKTWIAILSGLSVATGTDFLGRETRKGGVLYMDFELQPCFAQDRLWSVLQGKGLSVPPPNFMYWPLRGKCYDADRVLNVLEERINSIPDLAYIIADPIYKLASNIDENHAGSVTELLLSLERFSESTGAAILFTHHFNKSGTGANGDHMNKMSGSGSFARDPDTIMTMSRHPSVPNCLVAETTLRNMKSPDPFVIEVDPPLFALRDDVEVPVTDRSSRASHEDIFSILNNEGSLSPKTWENKSIQKFGITQKQFESAVGELRRKQKIFLKRDGDDGYLWVIEDK